MQFIEKNIKLESVSTNFVHLFNFFAANLSGKVRIFLEGRRGLGGASVHPGPSSLYQMLTPHPSTASVPITVLLYNVSLLCGFIMVINGLMAVFYWYFVDE